MRKKRDISKGEALATTASLAVALGGSTPVTAAALVLGKQALTWWSRNAGARAEAWWDAFLTACTDERIDLDEMRARIAEQMENNPETADVIMGHMRDVLDTVTSEAVAILGSLRGAYYRDGLKPDGFFRGATELLMQCTEADLEALRALAGRISCITPTTTTRTLALNSTRDPNTGVRKYVVAHVELENVGGATTRQDILGVAWEVDPLWKRLPHLLVSTGLARNDSQLYDFIVECDDMRRLHHLIRRRNIRLGTYHYYRNGTSNERSAELEAVPACFGYGETAEAAFASLKRNLARFVEDAETAELEKTPRRDPV